jgi:DNA-binding SARP family transcriptional activator
MTNAAMEMPRLELICFGPPEAIVGSTASDPCLRWRKNLALLIYLALSPRHSRTRDHILGILWPDKPEDKARHSLNEALRRLRATLGADRLITRGDTITINNASLWVDAVEFQDTVRQDVARAADIPQGEFLEGFTIESGLPFEEWAAEQRLRFHTAWSGALLARAEGALAGGRHDDARSDARRALQLMPYWEPAILLLLRSAALQGDVAGARTIYAEFANGLQTNFGATPSHEVQNLVERLAEGFDKPQYVPEQRDPPLIGREREHARAFALASPSATSGSRGLVIVGEPGMGKTRLLRECLQRFALDGGVCCSARPLEGDRDTPWSTLRMLMRSGLSGAPGLAGTDPDALSTLAALVPELAKRFTPTEPSDHAHVGAALAQCLDAVTEEQPVALAIDDAENADGCTLEALRVAALALDRKPFLLLMTVGVAETLAPPELGGLHSAVGRAIRGATVRLHPLSESDMHLLVERFATWCDSTDQIARMTRRLSFDAGGNPFLAVTLLRGLADSPTLKHDALAWPQPNATLESVLPFSIPDLLRVAVAARVSGLDPVTIRTVRAASVGQAAVDVELTAHLAESSMVETQQTLEELERRHFLTYDGERYVFAAPLIQQVIRDECLTRGERQRLRTHAAEVLAPRPDLESVVLRAELLVRAHKSAEGLRVAMEAASRSGDVRQPGLMRRALRAAETALDREDDAEARARIRELRKRLEGVV